MTLYQIAINIRRATVVFLIFAITVIILNAVFNFLFNRPESLFTPQVSPWEDIPLNAFGDVKFPQINALSISGDLSPRFDLRGSFPIGLPDTALIYEINQPREKLGAKERAQEVAKNLGFNPDGTQEPEPNLLVWENDRRTRTFTHNRVSRTWVLQTVSYFQDANALKPRTTKSDTNYGTAGKSMLSSLGLLTDNFTGGKVTAEFVRRTADRFQPTPFGQAPEYSVVEMFRKINMSTTKPGQQAELASGELITQYAATIYTDNPYQGSATAVIADNAIDPATEIMELRFTDFEYTSNSSYYLLKTPSVAWQDVQTGKGLLVSLIPETKSRFDDIGQLKVRRFTADADKTELAYLEPQTWTGYIYPIFVVQGTAELESGEFASFTFYVDAIRR